MTKTVVPFSASVVRVIDGDTVALDVDLGFDVHFHVNGRLYGCNAAEHGTPSGDAATTWLAALLPPGTVLGCVSHGFDKYGSRADVSLTLLSGPEVGQDVTALAIKTYHAAPWNGQGPKPVPPWPIPTETKSTP